MAVVHLSIRLIKYVLRQSGAHETYITVADVCHHLFSDYPCGINDSYWTSSRKPTDQSTYHMYVNLSFVIESQYYCCIICTSIHTDTRTVRPPANQLCHHDRPICSCIPTTNYQTKLSKNLTSLQRLCKKYFISIPIEQSYCKHAFQIQGRAPVRKAQGRS